MNKIKIRKEWHSFELIVLDLLDFSLCWNEYTNPNNALVIVYSS